MKTQHATSNAERALLVGVTWKRAPRIPRMPASEQGRESLAELVELARSAGADVAGTVKQVRDAADPATLVGRGKLDEIRAEATARKHRAPQLRQCRQVHAIQRPQALARPRFFANVRSAQSNHLRHSSVLESPRAGFRYCGVNPRYSQGLAHRLSRHARRGAGSRF